MAKIIAPQKSGSVGTSTFYSTPRGLMERQRVLPLDPRTPRQAAQRQLMHGVSGLWRQLTDAQRADWQALAGQLPGGLNGSLAFIKVNITRAACGLPTLAAAPPLPRFGILVSTGLTADDSPSVRLLQVSNTVAPELFIVEATPPVSAGLAYVEKLFRRVTVVPGHAGPAADLDLTAAYLERFCAPQAGERIFVRLCAMTNGFKDEPVQVSALVAEHGA